MSENKGFNIPVVTDVHPTQKDNCVPIVTIQGECKTLDSVFIEYRDIEGKPYKNVKYIRASILYDLVEPMKKFLAGEIT